MGSLKEIKNNEGFFEDLKKPEAIIEAQQDQNKGMNEEEQEYFPKVNLFFSFDIVNSTMYKSLTGNWPIIIKGLLEDIRTRVFKMQELSTSILWRVIGDEMIFVLTVYSLEEIGEAVDEIFEVTQRTSRLLQTGKFFDTLEGQSIQKNDIEMLKIQNPLSIKAASWLAIVNRKIENPYQCIKFNYSASSQNQIITEYLGKDIDAGFRLKSYTQDRRLVVSFELACMLAELRRSKELYIMDYVRLKGVWNESLYPIIWFHKTEIVKGVYQDTGLDAHEFQFANSFRYDETDNNDIVNRFFLRGKHKKGLRHLPEINTTYSLADSMFRVDSALKKIILDRNLEKKILYIKEILAKDILKRSMNPLVYPLEIHCAVVCCDVENRKVMITHRGENHNTNPGKWEFGCAKLSSDSKLVSSITDYYKSTFGLEIELVLDESRKERQPIPIAVYEIPNSGNIKKGIIFVARVKNVPNKNEFRAEKSHDKMERIDEESIIDYKESAVPDFESTIKKVFEDFKLFFPESM